MSSIFLKPEDQQVLCQKFNALLDYGITNFNYYKNRQHLYQKQISTLSQITQFPITDKRQTDILELTEQVLNQCPPAYFETSGTSGLPFPVIPDFSPEKTQEFANFIFEWLQLEHQPVKKAVIALPFEMNPIGLKYFFALNALNIMAIPAGVRTHLCTPLKMLDMITRLRPELLIARPLETLRYAEAMIGKGINPATCSIKKIILTGEIISKSKFERIRKLYATDSVYSVYGLTELDSGGLVSCSRNQYHLPSKPYLIVELLKDDLLSPVTNDGDIGHIVLTNTHQNYMPLLRYKTGDLGRLIKHCGCEYDTPVINLLGRNEDTLFSCGKRIFPIEIEQSIFQYPEFGSDYQLIELHDQYTIRLELLESLESNDVDKLKKVVMDELYSRLGLKMHAIEIYAPGKLVNKLGIAKRKAGTLYQLNCLTEDEIQDALEVNYCCLDGEHL
jgi:phenylacetate-CoA ligase